MSGSTARGTQYVLVNGVLVPETISTITKGDSTPGGVAPVLAVIDESTPDTKLPWNAALSALGSTADAAYADPTLASAGTLRALLLALYGQNQSGSAKSNPRNMMATDVVTTVAQLASVSATLASISAATTDTQGFYVGQCNHKLLLVTVSTPIIWTSSGQATIQLYASISPVTNSTGSSGLAPLVGTPANFGASGTSIAAGLYPFRSAVFTDLLEPHLYLGVRLVFPSAPTAGAATITITGVND